jgi:sulfite reductase alpha subunit-like flavoprotein
MASHANYKSVKKNLGFDVEKLEDGIQVSVGDWPEFLWMDTPEEVEEFGKFLVKEGQKLVAASKKLPKTATVRDPWKL